MDKHEAVELEVHSSVGNLNLRFGRDIERPERRPRNRLTALRSSRRMVMAHHDVVVLKWARSKPPLAHLKDYHRRKEKRPSRKADEPGPPAAEAY